ncbi:Pr6Pr family membrane protein [Arthrobacter sp. MYb213]|uniref:Pr6Pr family membrane protein n=1 Tax=Arthrobacter sp. MYb213 TaxID=1848595 RepID=UPI000CFC46EC|nr:Pr6Pr family membrane protein [Arthrobacter sp. MYb213]PRB70390.1 hypothetical protein CQ011_09585 [Arthrobacter sp. MYb213]
MSDHLLRRTATDEATLSGLPGVFLSHRWVALTYRIVALIIVGMGIIRISKVFSAEPVWNSFLFYTVQSNLLCLIWLMILISRTLRDLRQAGPRGASVPSTRWAAAVTMSITVTLLIYVLVLAPSDFVQSGDYVPFSLTDTLVHVVTPALLILDWLFFVPKGTLRPRDPALWLLIPLVYVIFALVAGGLGAEFFPAVHYPYPFMDVSQHGYPRVIVNALFMGVALLIVGYLLLLIDRLLARIPLRNS